MNDLDDDLLKELGLEPSISKAPPAKAHPTKEPTDVGLKAPESPVAKVAAKPVPPKKSEAVPPQKMAAGKTGENAAPMPEKPLAQGISRALDLQLIAVMGKKMTTLAELMDLKEGSVLDLNKLPNDLIDLVANGKMVAKGQLVLIDGRVGVQIKQVYK